MKIKNALKELPLRTGIYFCTIKTDKKTFKAVLNYNIENKSFDCNVGMDKIFWIDESDYSDYIQAFEQGIKFEKALADDCFRNKLDFAKSLKECIKNYN